MPTSLLGMDVKLNGCNTCRALEHVANSHSRVWNPIPDRDPNNEAGTCLGSQLGVSQNQKPIAWTQIFERSPLMRTFHPKSKTLNAWTRSCGSGQKYDRLESLLR